VKQAEFAENYSLAFSGNSKLAKLKKEFLQNSELLGKLVKINQAIALKHDRAACLTQERRASHHEILDGRHIERYWTGESPNFFKFDVAKIHSCKREDIFQNDEKIFFRRVGDRLIASLDTEHKYALNTIVVVTPKPGCQYDLRFLLGLFNSSAVNFFYLHFLKSGKKVFSEIQARQVARLPFPKLDLRDKKQKDIHDRISSAVGRIIETRALLPKAKTEHDRSVLESKFASFDKQIDRLVYEAYGLEPADIMKIEAI